MEDNSSTCTDPSLALTAEVERKLICGICLEPVGSDASEMVCGGRHTFCFDCITQYIDNLDDFNDAKCPTCRGGEGSVTRAPFLAVLSKIVHTQSDTDAKGVQDEADSNTGNETSDEDALTQYLRVSQNELMLSYPSHFLAKEVDIITAVQMKIFTRYRATPEFYGPVFHYHNHNHSSPNVNRNYAAVNVHESGDGFFISVHSTRNDANRVLALSPQYFNLSFCVEMQNDTEAVREDNENQYTVFQCRPVEIHMRLPILSYLNGMSAPDIASSTSDTEGVRDEVDQAVIHPAVKQSILSFLRSSTYNEEEPDETIRFLNE
jgi:hypothetical protein